MYFLSLFITATAHASVYGAVWSTTVYNVSWFEDAQNMKIDFPQEYRTKVQRVPYENPVFRGAEEDDDAPLAPPNVLFAQLENIDLEMRIVLIMSNTDGSWKTPMLRRREQLKMHTRTGRLFGEDSGQMVAETRKYQFRTSRRTILRRSIQ